MIKLPKEIAKIVKTLEVGGFAAYTVGGCVRDSIAGRQPEDWDLATSARLEDMLKLFPDAEVLNERLNVIRLEFITEHEEDGEVYEEGIIADVATFRKESNFVNGKPETITFVDTIEEDLERRDFTVNAIADSPARGVVDPYFGREDIKRKLIRTINDANEAFAEDPVRMLRAITICSEADFDLQKATYDAICDNYEKLYDVSISKIRNGFERIMSGDFAGKGLNMLAATGIMNVVLGEEVFSRMNIKERRDFSELCERIDCTKPIPDRRMGLVFSIISRRKSLSAIDRLEFEGDTRQHLIDSATMMENLYFIKEKPELKKMLLLIGRDRYDYVHNLSKAQRKVYDQSDSKILSRNHMMKEIEAYNEPIYVEDLVIDGNDIIEAGIAEGDKVGELLTNLAEYVHKNPKLNNRKELLKTAKRFKRNKFLAMTSGVKWLR